MKRRRLKVTTRPMIQVRASDQLLRFSQVRELISLSRTTLWRKIREGTFPAPIRLSEKARGWRLSVIRAWISSREASRCA